jgi:uncharacterized protein (TIGR02145 family)
MQKVSLILSAVMMTSMMLSSCGGSASKEEGASKEVTIGKQVWMTENLNVDKFQNRDVIPEAKTAGEWKAYGDAEEAAWCYYDNDRKNGEKYGKLYNWYAVNDSRGLAPKGWHVPTDEEWTQLTVYLGGVEKAGAKMKSKDGWYNNGNGTNSSGFSGLPGGVRIDDGAFGIVGVGGYGFWWSSTSTVHNTSDTSFAWSRSMEHDHSYVSRDISSKSIGFSVRCLRD